MSNGCHNAIQQDRNHANRVSFKAVAMNGDFRTVKTLQQCLQMLNDFFFVCVYRKAPRNNDEVTLQILTKKTGSYDGLVVDH
jgi:hypothetical protein